MWAQELGLRSFTSRLEWLYYTAYGWCWSTLMQDGRLEILQYLLAHDCSSHVDNIGLRLEACSICTA